MRAQITFKSGAQIIVDVSQLTTGRNPVTNELTSIKWTTPQEWHNKLHTLELSEVVAIVMIDNDVTREQMVSE